MAQFEPAHAITAANEGGYANNKLDRGGETWKGVARNFWPNWPGWLLVDEQRRQPGFPKNLWGSTDLQRHVLSFYKVNFWNVLKLDSVASQAIANELYDTGVNTGTGTAGTFLQRALNLTNKNGTLYADLVVDGKVGPATLSALNKHPNPPLVLKVLNVLQGAHYVKIAEANRTQEAFMQSWMARVSLV
jgi:lysozyme family protein